MYNSRVKRHWRLIAAAVVGGVVAALAVAVPASAADVDLSRDGTSSLTIEKQRATARYTVYSVESSTQAGAPDLTTNDGWREVEALSSQVGDNPTQAALNGAGYATTPLTPTTSDGSGQVYTNLDFGLYYVVESTPASGFDPVRPFLVTVPTTDATGTAWTYDVTVSPKNRAITSKGVEDADAVRSDIAGSAGSTVTWTITGNIEDGDDDEYIVTDLLDERLRFLTARAFLGSAALTPTTDYTVGTTVEGARTEVTLALTPTGLAKLNAADPSTTQVVVEVDTTVTAGARGEIENTATINQTGIVTEVPGITTRWGGVRVTKQNPAGTALAGASFQVFSSHTNDFSTATATGIDGTTGSDGVALLSSLRYSDYASGDFITASSPAYQYYWLVETAAPSGYELLPDPVPFTITTDNTTASIVALTVENVPVNGGFTLPLTGGVIPPHIFYIIGVLLIGGMILLLARSRRAHA